MKWSPTDSPSQCRPAQYNHPVRWEITHYSGSSDAFSSFLDSMVLFFLRIFPEDRETRVFYKSSYSAFSNPLREKKNTPQIEPFQQVPPMLSALARKQSLPQRASILGESNTNVRFTGKTPRKVTRFVMLLVPYMETGTSFCAGSQFADTE